MRAFYNENDPKAAAWLAELIKEGLIPDGKIDTRDIRDITGKDLAGFDQCHFFAGIGGWAEALRLANWTGPVWTGSCPCQPFSVAGQGLAEKDPRHLWPEFRRLIQEWNPPVVFGEQVASKLGRNWLSGVRLDLEALGYAVGAADLCAASVWAPHKRQRLFWVGKSISPGLEKRIGNGQLQPEEVESFQGETTFSGGDVGSGREKDRELPRGLSVDYYNYDVVLCEDQNGWPGIKRRIEPGSYPLAHGIPHRMGLLRGYGNAIVPQIAAEFIKASR